MGVEEIVQQYNFSGWGWLKLGKGQQYLFKYEVIMDLLKFKSKRVLLYLLLLLNLRGGGGRLCNGWEIVSGSPCRSRPTADTPGAADAAMGGSRTPIIRP